MCITVLFIFNPEDFLYSVLRRLLQISFAFWEEGAPTSYTLGVIFGAKWYNLGAKGRVETAENFIQKGGRKIC